MDVAGVLQEAGDADSRTHTGSQVPVEYTIIPYTSMTIRLPHICQDIMIIVLLLHMMGDGKLGSCFIYVTV